MLTLVLFQPDIPQNSGAIFRLCAGFGFKLAIIEPAGFLLTDRHFRRAGMDYINRVNWLKYPDYPAFRHSSDGQGRQILLTTRVTTAYYDFAFEKDDCLILGQESSGAPEWLHHSVDFRLTIPMKSGIRSLNQAMSAAIVSAEACRQFYLAKLL